MESAENSQQPMNTNPKEEELNNSPSLSKTETLKLLNDSIDRLEETIKGISENAATDLPSSDSINTLLTTTQELADSVTSPPSVVSPSEPVASENSNVEQVEILKVIPPKAKTAKAKTPSVKPKAKKNVGLMIVGLSVFAAAIALALWFLLPHPQTTISSLSKQINQIVAQQINPQLEATELEVSEIVLKPINPEPIEPEVTETASKPINPEPIEPEVTETASKPTNLELIEPEVTEAASKLTNLEPEVITPSIVDPKIESDHLTTTDLLVDTTADENESELELPVETAIPQDLASPGRVKDLKMVTIEPDLTFTPEQKLIATLKSKFIDLTQEYNLDFVDSVRLNVPTSSVLIEVTDDWYELEESSQNQLADDIWQRSRQLNFSKLEFKDDTGRLVARNPVVGKHIIVLESSKSY